MTLAALVSYLKANGLLIVMLGGLGVFLGMHLIWYIHPSEIKTYADLQARLTGGQPTVIEFYSNL